MQPTALPLSSPIEKAAVVAVFAALSLGTNYALIDVPNVKLMDVFVFIAAYLFGLRIGLSVAVTSWAVYGFVNPYGQDDLILLSFLIVGECFYAISGFLVQNRLSQGILRRPGFLPFSLLAGVTGLLATFAYDVLTNFASWIFRTNSLYAALVVGNITGAPFSLIHEASNLVLFALVVPSAIVAAERFSGSTRLGVRTG